MKEAGKDVNNTYTKCRYKLYMQKMRKSHRRAVTATKESELAKKEILLMRMYA